ncbi:hypothetical protein BJV78DRAFT_1157633 [Lactifluus subvellereus]|nr:hypothetical protein BJV78DRAFT_1157633 [Lactifluus subvellereus]
MTAPTQQLPSWLSYSTSLATNSAGQATATFTTVITLPLTYYGPPIPLGPDDVWVYGGLTSPAPSPFNPTNPLPTTPGSIMPSSTLAIPSSVTPAPSTARPTPSSASRPSPSSSLPIGGESSSNSHHVRVIVGAVLGAVLGSLLLLFLAICFLRRRQRGQRSRNYRPEPPTSQVMWMWHDVPRNDDDQDADVDTQLHSAGEGSPQSSGDEHDTFLRHSRDASHGTRDAQSTARPVDTPRRSHESTGPIGIALAPVSKATAGDSGRRYIISREQLAEPSSGSLQNRDLVKAPDEAELGPDEPLLPPPTLNLNVSHGSRKSLLNSERSMTPGNDPELALLYTAQRVQVGQSSQPPSESPWHGSIGIPSILRRSWLSPRTRSATPSTSSPKSSFFGRQLTDNELEVGRGLNLQLRSEMSHRDGARPISGVSALSAVSARSGNTVFYDASSREDVSSPPPPVPPLPQGTASTGRNGYVGLSPLSADPIRASDESEGPPAYEPTSPNTGNSDDAVDYLDVPIPRPASPFASASSTRRLSAPPGLTIPGSYPQHDLAVDPSPDASGGINMELLEEAPPAAGESWRQIAQALPVYHERRTTFGLPVTIVYPREPTVSEQGSLHSMRSHLSPHSALSASGSAPASNSNSEHSRGFTASSLRSLAHSSSISSTDRRLVRRNPGEVSPPLSATGRHFAAPSPSRGIRVPSPPPEAVPPPATSATVTSTATRSSVTTHTSVTDPITGEVSRFPHAAWTGGRDLVEEDGLPPPPRSWNGSWSSPSHLRILQNRVAGRDDASHA